MLENRKISKSALQMQNQTDKDFANCKIFRRPDDEYPAICM